MKLVLFDFDGTLTGKDSFLQFMLYSRGRLMTILGLMLLSPVMLLFKAGIIKNWRAKELLMKYFWGGIQKEQFDSMCTDFAQSRIPGIIRPEALQRLQMHKKQKDTIIIVTASAECWIRPWAETMGVDLIGTQLEIENNRITGRISGKNCYGEEKVKRLREHINIASFDEIEVYGDSRGDKEILQLATISHYRTF